MIFVTYDTIFKRNRDLREAQTIDLNPQDKEQQQLKIIDNITYKKARLTKILNPIRRTCQKCTSNYTIIKSPLNNFNSRNTKNNLSSKTYIKWIVDRILRDIIIIRKSWSVSIKKSKCDCIRKCDQTKT